MKVRLIIGLTGNIATGKSAVMKMAADQSALTIDADKVVHDLLSNDPEIQQAVENAFGRRVRTADGGIDRAELGRIVFADEDALHELEELLHPATRLEITRRVQESSAEIVMIEAIKLLEGPLAEFTDEVWVTHCSPECQMERLLVCRGLDEATAEMRINAQSPQADKIARADVVINTDGLMQETRVQFNDAWTAALRGLSVD